MIYATSPEGVIGVAGTIPWNHPGDVRRFKRVTLGTTIIMGRLTFESVGRALPRRRNIVVTGHPFVVADVECAASVAEAVERAGDADVWFIGGARIYEEAMKYVDVIDVTYVPDHVTDAAAVRAPAIDETVFEPTPIVPHEDEPGLTRQTFVRRSRPTT